MSKTYRKVISFNDGQTSGTKWAQRQANKKVRRTKDVPNGRAYKKLYDSWNIRDFKSNFYTEREAREYIEDSWFSTWKGDFHKVWKYKGFQKKKLFSRTSIRKLENE